MILPISARNSQILLLELVKVVKLKISNLVIQAFVMISNISTGILITRYSDYSLRADISIISAITSISLIILNQGQFESLIKGISSKRDRNGFFQIVIMMFVSIITGFFYDISISLAFLMFCYMTLNMFVQFKGADFFHTFGNSKFLAFSMFFYLSNLAVTATLVLLDRLNVFTWLLSSIFADLLLLTAYRLKMPGNLESFYTPKYKSRKIASLAAVLAGMQDFFIIVFASLLVSDPTLAFLIVTYSCVSPMLIFFGALQNNILRNPEHIADAFLKKLNIWTVLFIVSSLAAYYLLVRALVPYIFGPKYEILSDSAGIVVLFGVINLTNKLFNIYCRACSRQLDSIKLSLLIFVAFGISSSVFPETDLVLVQCFVFSSILAYLCALISKFFFRKRTEI